MLFYKFDFKLYYFFFVIVVSLYSVFIYLFHTPDLILNAKVLRRYKIAWNGLFNKRIVSGH